MSEVGRHQPLEGSGDYLPKRLASPTSSFLRYSFAASGMWGAAVRMMDAILTRALCTLTGTQVRDAGLPASVSVIQDSSFASSSASRHTRSADARCASASSSWGVG